MIVKNVKNVKKTKTRDSKQMNSRDICSKKDIWPKTFKGVHNLHYAFHKN